MSTKAELQAQRNELFNHLEETRARVEELDRQINAPNKPKYGLGDIIMNENGHCYVNAAFFPYKNKHGLVNSEGEILKNLSWTDNKGVKIGRLVDVIDDLKVNQEDVKFFKIDRSTSQCTSTQQCTIYVSAYEDFVEINDIAGGIRVYLENLPAFVLKLGQMQATIERNKK